MQYSSVMLRDFKTSFLSCEKDREAIWRKLFIESRPHSDKLIRLLAINTKDCLDQSQSQYDDKVGEYRSLAMLKKDGYILDSPKLEFPEHSDVKSYLMLDFNNFTPSNNPLFRNCMVDFNIMCNLKHWELDNYKTRPWNIAGYIDGIINEEKFSGIGTLNFFAASQYTLSQDIGGVLLRYMATHGSDDSIEDKNED